MKALFLTITLLFSVTTSAVENRNYTKRISRVVCANDIRAYNYAIMKLNGKLRKMEISAVSYQDENSNYIQVEKVEVIPGRNIISSSAITLFHDDSRFVVCTTITAGRY